MSSRNWIITKNNPDTTLCEDYLRKWKEYAKCAYVTGQLEKGKEGTVHLQFFLNFSDKVRLAHVTKHDKHIHAEIVRVNNGADDYCNKEDTRIEGPWSFGIKPARLNKKGDKARRNADLLEMGPEEAVKQGYIDIAKYLDTKKNIDAYKLATAQPKDSDTVRGVWIYGKPGVGKSKYARTHYTDIYLKAQNKWWDGYTG